MHLLNWSQRYRIRNFLKNSVWFPPVLGMVAAVIFHRLIRLTDLSLGLYADVTTDGARALLGALAASMFTFIVFVFSILLLSVQLASAQLTPRIIAFFYRNPVLKFSLTVFVFSFTFSLAVLFRIAETVPLVSLWIAVYSNLACIGIFLYMIDNVGKSLRPISLLSQIGSKGQQVILDVYPLPFTEADEQKSSETINSEGESHTIIKSSRTGVVLAFDMEGLVKLASHKGFVIELIPQVGDFVTYGEPLFKIKRGDGKKCELQLQQSIAIGPERTLEQDPGFAFRIIVDIASKALSPAINDPTTAVIAIDQIHRLLRTVSLQKLDSGQTFDHSGQLRLIYRTPIWEDFLSLAITEIRQYGRDSLQVARRLKSMLENLMGIVPQKLVKSIQVEIDALNRSVEREFQDPKDLLLANSSDSLGIGGSR
ncbi:MAG: DUF2254 domain-containing protein [Bacteroidales bacterium]